MSHQMPQAGGPGNEAKIIPMPGVQMERFAPPASEVAPLSEAPEPTAWETPVVPREGARQWVSDRYWDARLRLREGLVSLARSPLAYLRTCGYAHRGAWVSFARWWVWAWWLDDRRAFLSIKVHGTAQEQKKIKAEIKRRRNEWRRVVAFRWVLTLAVVAAVAYGASWLWQTHTELAVLAALAAPAGLGILGGSRERRGVAPAPVDVITPTAVIPAREQPGEIPPESRIQRAFVKAELVKANDPDQFQVVGVPFRDGQAWAAHIAAPEGVTYAEVVKKQEKIASALGRPAACLELEPLSRDGDYGENEFNLHMAFAHPARRDKPRWPLLDAEQNNIFRPYETGWDLRGRPVLFNVAWVHTLMGAGSNMGKTTIERQVALAALLDRRALLMIADFGGGADFKPFRPFCRVFIHGESEEQVIQFRDLLVALREEYRRRQALLDTLSVEECPEGKITEALASRPEFAPILVLADEFQAATSHPLHGEEIITLWAELEKVCRKAGIWFLKATQAMDDSVPTRLRNISLQRIALTVATYQASIAILGNDAYKLGLDASQLGGISGYGILWGIPSKETRGFQGKVSFPNVTVQDAHETLQRIGTWRRRYLPGEQTVEHFAGDVRFAAPSPAAIVPGDGAPDDGLDGAGVPTVVLDVLAVWPKGLDNVHRDRLAELVGLSETELTQQMQAAGVSGPDPVRMHRLDKKPVQRGWRWADVVAAKRAGGAS